VLDVNSPAVPIALFAAAYAGVPYVPMNYRLTKPELEALLGRIAPALLISDEPVLAPLELPAGVKVMLRGEFQRLALSFTPRQSRAPGEPHDTAIQLFTSGTTGKPKAAVLRHQQPHVLRPRHRRVRVGGEDDAILISVPPVSHRRHLRGPELDLRRPAHGAAAELRRRDLAAAVPREKVTNAFVVPTMLSRIVDHLEQEGGVPACRRCARSPTAAARCRSP
jgi:long-chain acyl-CoA synthetase